ncbi:MAG: trypsin-like peptidase domain-containing protein [Planctomycetota bacterium]
MASATKALQLQPLNVPGLGAIDVTELGVTIGRSPDNGVVISGIEFPHVSSFHARVRLADGGLVIEDLGSKNGTLINGKPASSLSNLLPGQLIQLGSFGPRFLVVDRSAGAEARLKSTVLEMATLAPREPEFTVSPAAAPRRASPSMAWWVIGVVATLVLGLFFGGNYWVRKHDEDVESRRRLELQCDKLAAQLAAIEARGSTSVAEIDRLKRELTDHQRRLAEYAPPLGKIPPSTVGQSPQADSPMQAVLAAVVLVECVATYRHPQNSAKLYVQGASDYNYEQRGRVVEQSNSGSGFCVSEEGWILTNTHVLALPALEGVEAVAQREVVISFSGAAGEYSAEIVREGVSGEPDLALLRIKPFARMPHVVDFQLNEPLPSDGDPVFLIGFRYGREVPQEDDRVRAAVSEGVVSRKVTGFIETSARLHPGGSGGPVLNRAGRIIGIARGVYVDQTTGRSVQDISFVIPIADAKFCWPPARTQK